VKVTIHRSSNFTRATSTISDSERSETLPSEQDLSSSLSSSSSSTQQVSSQVVDNKINHQSPTLKNITEKLNPDYY
jgi:hypothetical protein